LIFTELGKVYWLKAYEVPEGSKVSKGRPLQNIINIDKTDKVRAVISVKDLKNEDYTENHYLVMCTEKGIIKKTRLKEYSRPRQSGIQAITIKEGDTLLDVALTDGESQIVLAARSGQAIRFEEEKVRAMGRTAAGVRGINISETNKVVGMVTVSDENSQILVVSEKGYGKRSSLDEYRLTNRGGKGVRTLNVTEKTGELVTVKNVTDNDQLMIINKSGVIIRFSISELRVMGRATQGVRIIKLNETDEISSVAKIAIPEDDQVEEQIEETENQDSIEVLEENFSQNLSQSENGNTELEA